MPLQYCAKLIDDIAKKKCEFCGKIILEYAHFLLEILKSLHKQDEYRLKEIIYEKDSGVNLCFAYAY